MAATRNDLDVPTSATPGASRKVAEYEQVAVYITAEALSATIDIQTSPDDVHWITEATISAPGKVVIDGPTYFVRAYPTAYTSSTGLGGHVVGARS